MGWWAPVWCGMSVHCVLKHLLLDYMARGAYFLDSALVGGALYHGLMRTPPSSGDQPSLSVADHEGYRAGYLRA
jgi:hypothetical protein